MTLSESQTRRTVLDTVDDRASADVAPTVTAFEHASRNGDAGGRHADADTGVTGRRPQPGYLPPGVTMMAALFVAAVAIRWFEIRRSYNIFIDEITYAQLGHNLASGQGLTLYGSPFNLHPPTAFGLFAGIIDLFGLEHLPVDQLILDLRPFVAVFGAGTAVLATVLARRSCVRSAGVAGAAVGLLVAIDPFVVSFDSRVMLEAIAQFFAAACVSCVVSLSFRQHRAASRRRLLVVLGGLAAGGAFTTKETFGLVLGVTLLVLLVLPRLVRRRDAFGVLAIGVACYAAETAWVWATTGFEPWWQSHTSGLSRLIGTHQTTGFNAATTKVSLVSRVAADIDLFAGSYLVLALGGVAVLVHLVRTRPWRGQYANAAHRSLTIVAVWGFVAGAYLVYATLVGSIEEQMYYIPLAPFVIVLVATIAGVRGKRRALFRVGAALAVVVLAFDLSVWFRVHTSDNNTYEHLIAWEQANVSVDSRIAVADDSSQFLLHGVAIGQWTTLHAIEANNADFVIADSSLVQQGYSAMSVSTFDYLRRHAIVAFEAHSDTDGTLYVFDVRRLLS